jgi:TPR repeat protein
LVSASAALLLAASAPVAQAARIVTPSEELDLVTRAELGDVGAQYRLGRMYATGDGLQEDLALAVVWLSRAAALGDSSAQTFLGTMYATGDKVPLDYARAVALYRAAAEQGDATASYNLA